MDRLQPPPASITLGHNATQCFRLSSQVPTSTILKLFRGVCDWHSEGPCFREDGDTTGEDDNAGWYFPSSNYIGLRPPSLCWVCIHQGSGRVGRYMLVGERARSASTVPSKAPSSTSAPLRHLPHVFYLTIRRLPSFNPCPKSSVPTSTLDPGRMPCRCQDYGVLLACPNMGCRALSGSSRAPNLQGRFCSGWIN